MAEGSAPENRTAAERKAELEKRCPEISPELIARVVERFPPHYFERFSDAELAEHLGALATLSSKEPVQVRVQQAADGAEVTFFSYDAPGEFSVLAGLLSATGFDIASGQVYTEGRPDSSTQSRPLEHRRHRRAQHTRHGARAGARSWYRRASAASTTSEQSAGRFIVDHFFGHLRGPFDSWKSELTDKAREFLTLIHTGGENQFDEVKRRITEEVATALDRFPVRQEQALYPVDVAVEPHEGTTRMRVTGVDTPFFLYALSSALVLHNMSIERVEIHTRGEQIEDLFEFVDSSGRAVTDERRLNQLRLSVAFTKQFTYFLTVAPDRYQALLRFERLIQDFLTLSERDQLDAVLSSPKVLQDLARLLGASDFLWEDFIRLQHEQLLPLLEQSKEKILSHSPGEISQLLESELSRAETFEEKRRILNDFKDHEIYLVDLDHILHGELDFFFLSSRLTALAEAVVEAAVRICREKLTRRYGTPRTVAGIPAHLAVMGLGKLGGEALGYASDIEMMFLYSDAGETDGGGGGSHGGGGGGNGGDGGGSADNTEGMESIRNAEFFAHLVGEITSFIEAKREGIFQVDLRLRPYGAAGATASSLAQFSRYYSGEASSLEKLALVRMRRVAGDPEFGARVERLRDDLVYAADSIDVAELKHLREVQLKSKGRRGALNAKFSPGGLVDLEYSVQILQVTLGRANPKLRTPRIHVALRELVAAGELDAAEADRLVEAYHFLRKLINGLRMLRGNAKDLFLPAVDSLEYQHLARRMGYQGKERLGPAEQLHVEFETRTAQVRVFVERELGRDALPGSPQGTIADIVLADEISPQRAAAILRSGGFTNTERSLRNLRGLAGDGNRKYLFAELSILAWDVFTRVPDADLALNNWEKLVASQEEPEAHFRELVHQPQRLEILLTILATSQFLSDTLFRDPELLGWATTPSVIGALRREEDMQKDLARIEASSTTRDEWLDEVRRFRRREILRIGTRDICLGVELPEVTKELSNLARTIVSQSLQRILRAYSQADPHRFAVLAFGKLGGNELNYSSDIDLLAVYDPDPRADPGNERHVYTSVMTELNQDLTEHTVEGYLYRVDLRLRPYGSSGMLVYPLQAAIRYYHSQAAPWEQQAAIKLGPVAGNLELARRMVAETHRAIPTHFDPQSLSAGIRRLREQKTRRLEAEESIVDVKEGRGGIRDIEFLVQGLQLLYLGAGETGGLAGAGPGHAGEAGAGDHGGPERILEPNTLDAIEDLRSRGILEEKTASQLRSDYIFLRKAEHVLQIAADRQVHSLSPDGEEADIVARRMQQAQAMTTDFWPRLRETLERVHAYYDEMLIPPQQGD
ncbi:MAG: glutamate-ammonia-ligase adenylyltransferase [Spirochaetia bacterium]